MVRGNTTFISSVEHIICSTREINLVFPSTHVFFCLLYKQNCLLYKQNWSNILPTRFLIGLQK